MHATLPWNQHPAPWVGLPRRLLVRLVLLLVLLPALLGPAAAQDLAVPRQPLARLESGVHTAAVTAVATDRAGRWAVTASQDRTARVWELPSGRAAGVLRPPQDDDNEGKLFAAAISPDGRQVAVAGRTRLGSARGHTIYLFDRESTRMLGRIQDLPEPVLCLAWSPDGRWLGAGLQGRGGLRLFDTASGAERGRDDQAGDNTSSLHFSPDAQRLVSTRYDGVLRLHAVDAQGRLTTLASQAPAGGRKPQTAVFAPDGRSLAVGFADSTAVQVLDAATLAELARPSTAGVDNGNLGRVAWSADGRSLLAAGTWARAGGQGLRRWSVDDWARPVDALLGHQAVAALVPRPGPEGGWLYASHEPGWGVLDAAARVLHRQDAAIIDFQDLAEGLQVSADGKRVRFPARGRGDAAMLSFDLPTRTLDAGGDALAPARTEAPGLVVQGWRGGSEPTLNGKALQLDRHEPARSLAIAPDGKRFVLGSGWNLRLFDGPGRARWRQPVPGVVWGLNISGDGRFVVAAHGDGSIRWRRLVDGQEVLALYPHADGRRWVAWTPEGYFDASPGAEHLVGFHLNHGGDQAGELVPARQLWETFYQPGLIARRLDPDGDELLRELVKRRGDVRQLLADAALPLLQLESPATASTDGRYLLAVRVLQAGQGGGRLVLRVDGGAELAGRWNTPALTPGSVVQMPVDLAEGQRRLSVELVDARGLASRPVSAEIAVRRTEGSAAGATLHVLAVGVGNYRHITPRLRFAADDARAVASRLVRNGGARFQQRVVTRTLTDEEATAARIGATLAEMAAKARPDDTFVLFMAGHGTVVDGQYHFLPWDLAGSDDASVRRQGIAQDQLRRWLSQLPAKSLLLLDTCRAGQAALGAGGGAEEDGAVSALSRLSQRSLIAASSADNVALEGYNGHGVFSWVLLDALDRADYDDNGSVDVSDIATHARRLVPSITEKVFKYRQRPTQNTPGDPFAVALPLQKGR